MERDSYLDDLSKSQILEVIQRANRGEYLADVSGLYRALAKKALLAPDMTEFQGFMIPHTLELPQNDNA